MKLLFLMSLLSSIVISFVALADTQVFKQYLNMPYSQVRVSLLNEGWKPVSNKNIHDTSLYAQTIYEKGYDEVTDCISMERDQCQFILSKGKKHILITTKEKSLNVESIELRH
jgi:hypothetical protein